MNELAASLAAGVDVISQGAEITFVPYVKLVLPLDGYVFWVKAQLLGPTAVPAVSPLAGFQINQPRRAIVVPEPFTARGSLHLTTVNQQDPDESNSVNRVVFTSLTEVDDLNTIAPDTMYIATQGQFRFAFSQRRFYQQANLYHYAGDAVYPVLESQIIDSLEGFDTQNVIVSNSLPIWLALNAFMPMYPSFLVNDNIRPPYAAVHIPEEATRALQAAPFIDRTGSHWQLVADRVRITMYGLRNFNALDFQDYVFAASLANPGLFGIMDAPVIRDVKRTQVEISAIAQKKSFEVEVSYYQQRIRNDARQLILSAIPTYIIAN